MRYILVSLIAAIATSLTAYSAPSSPATALDSTPKHPFKQFYLVGGHEVDPATAIVQSLSGREAYKCTAVVAMVSKSGTSIGVKNIKKPAKNN